eukprot:11124211-Alexandrium_andersonii.AAC.1
MSNLPRSSAPTGTHDMPVVAMDTCFFAKDISDITLAALAVKGRDSRAISAHPVLCKGRLRDDTVDQAVASVRRLGHHRRA